MGEKNVGRALTVGGQANEEIRFVEDDESSSDRRPPNIPPQVSLQIQTATATVVQRLQNSREGSYAEIAAPKTISPPTSRYVFTKSKEKIRADQPVQKTRRKSDLVLNIFSRTPSFKKSRQEYEKVSVREDSTYSNIVESPSFIKTAHGGESGFRLRSFAGLEIKRSEVNAEDDEQTLEVLRQVVRKCTNPDPMKRPSSIDVLELVNDTPGPS